MRKRLIPSSLLALSLAVAPARGFDSCPNNGYCAFDQWVHVGHTVQYVIWYTSWCSPTGITEDCRYSLKRTFDSRVGAGDWETFSNVGVLNPHTRDTNPNSCGSQADTSSVLNLPDDNVGYYATNRDFRVRLQVWDTSAAGGGVIVQDDYWYFVGYIPQ